MPTFSQVKIPEKSNWGGHRHNQTGRPKIDNPLVIISAAIPPELKQQIRDKAKVEKTTASELVRAILTRAVEE